MHNVATSVQIEYSTDVSATISATVASPTPFSKAEPSPSVATDSTNQIWFLGALWCPVIIAEAQVFISGCNPHDKSCARTYDFTCHAMRATSTWHVLPLDRFTDSTYAKGTLHSALSASAEFTLVGNLRKEGLFVGFQSLPFNILGT